MLRDNAKAFLVVSSLSRAPELLDYRIHHHHHHHHHQQQQYASPFQRSFAEDVKKRSVSNLSSKSYSSNSETHKLSSIFIATTTQSICPMQIYRQLFEEMCKQTDRER
jgi:hypothetical protein